MVVLAFICGVAVGALSVGFVALVGNAIIKHPTGPG
jgi:hypothetical protein